MLNGCLLSISRRCMSTDRDRLRNLVCKRRPTRLDADESAVPRHNRYSRSRRVRRVRPSRCDAHHAFRRNEQRFRRRSRKRRSEKQMQHTCLLRRRRARFRRNRKKCPVHCCTRHFSVCKGRLIRCSSPKANTTSCHTRPCRRPASRALSSARACRRSAFPS